MVVLSDEFIPDELVHIPIVYLLYSLDASGIKTPFARHRFHTDGWIAVRTNIYLRLSIYSKEKPKPESLNQIRNAKQLQNSKLRPAQISGMGYY